MTDRTLQVRAFLDAAGWGPARAVRLAGDASTRSYHRLFLGNQTAILLDGATDGRIVSFLQIDRHLLSLGLSAPQILAQDVPQNLLLLEDFGDGLLSRLVLAEPGRRNSLYSGAIDVLVALHPHPPPIGLKLLDPEEMAQIAAMLVDWYVPAAGEQPASDPVAQVLPDARRAEFTGLLAAVAAPLLDGQRVLMLRDYHAENLIWLPERKGAARVGLLDFQDAMSAHPAYDLVSILQDARRDVPADLETAMIARYSAATGQDAEAFRATYAVMGAQRAMRILGIFARLALHSGKPDYLAHAPRVWRQLHRNLAHPALSKLAQLCHQLVPEPTPTILQRIKDQCANPLKH